MESRSILLATVGTAFVLLLLSLYGLGAAKDNGAANSSSVQDAGIPFSIVPAVRSLPVATPFTASETVWLDWECLFVPVLRFYCHL